jgi:hypothetical protein
VDDEFTELLATLLERAWRRRHPEAAEPRPKPQIAEPSR